ncbi:MAG TPA: hypothetical protein VHU80_00175, partial [Polyangiaceae bacterium]|nr:hypothetical protein [Polyangiaceae bacterium]
MNNEGEQTFWAWLKEGPLDRSFWLGEVDARGVGIFRAGLGAILLFDILSTFPSLNALYGSSGVWPPSLGRGPLVHVPDAALPLVWSFGAVVVASFTLGIASRVSATLTWLFLVAVHQRNPAITTGGDFLGQILVFLCIWLDTGAAFSVDARFFGRARSWVLAGPWRAMQLHLALLYFVTARLKVRGGWLRGDGIYVSLQHYGFLRPPGAFLLDHPSLCRVACYFVLALEAAYPFFSLSPVKNRQTRLVAMVMGLAVQLGILMTMRVGSFTALMLWSSLLLWPLATRPAPQATATSRMRHVLAGLPVLLVVTISWGAFLGRRLPLPAPLRDAEEKLGLVQPFELFGSPYEVAHWRAEGKASDGQRVDLLSAAAPGFLSEIRWLYSPFYKLTFTRDADDAAIARWLCREG